jgi:3-oxoacyl-[acyl-carrier-protein] synthase-3
VEECSSDLGVLAAEKLFASGACSPKDIDYLLFCTQSPDYYLPTTACLLQHRLGIPTSAGALDFNLGCSGFVYGLGIAKGLIETGQASRLLLVTAETYSKFMHPGDRSVRTIFGDGAAATLVEAVSDVPNDSVGWIGPFVVGTDGSGASNLIVPAGGLRQPRSPDTARVVADSQGNLRSADNLFMNGPEIFSFTLRVVPKAVRDLLVRSGKTLDQVDLFVFHQANKYMLDHLRKKLDIAPERFWLDLHKYGNTVSSTVPIALKDAMSQGRLRRGANVVIAGFGVGYSWAVAFLKWYV